MQRYRANFGGSPGAGKSTLFNWFDRELNLNKPLRETNDFDKDKSQYIYRPTDEWLRRFEERKLLNWPGSWGHKVAPTTGVIYLWGTPHPSQYPAWKVDQILRLTMFGEIAPRIKQELEPGLITFYFWAHPDVLKSRMRRRAVSGDYPDSWIKQYEDRIDDYERRQIWKHHDFVIDTSHDPIDVTVKKVLEKIGLAPQPLNLILPLR
jgi:hypothetical protein